MPAKILVLPWRQQTGGVLASWGRESGSYVAVIYRHRAEEAGNFGKALPESACELADIGSRDWALQLPVLSPIFFGGP